MEDFSKQELDELQSWLDGLKLNEIPEPSEWDRSLMDITGIKNHENMWSDIYKFFFTPSEEHKMDDLFITSLEQLTGINPFLSDYNYNVEREFGNRIDLVLYNKNKRRAIIIENKVKHILNNDLNNYQSSIKKFLGSPCTIKTVVLGLHHYDLDKYEKASEISKEDKFSITHKELLDKVFENSSDYLKDAPSNYVYLLKEFYKNISNMTNAMNEKEFDFYFNKENKDKINLLYKLRKHVLSHIYKTIEDTRLLEQKFAENDWKLSVKTKAKETDNYVYYTFDAMPNRFMLTLVYDRLWSDPNDCHIGLFLEVGGKDTIQAVEKYSITLRDMGIFPDGHKQEKIWWHYKGYKINFSKEELKREEVIIEKIIDGIRQSGFYEDGLKMIDTLRDKF